MCFKLKPAVIVSSVFCAILVIFVVRKQAIGTRNLESYLEKGDWKKADQETSDLILRISGRGLTGDITDLMGWENSLGKFPCSELRNIDNLWMKYSQGRFGLSVQKEMFKLSRIGFSSVEEFQQYKKFLKELGWTGIEIDRSITEFTLQAPRGHLPSPQWMLDAGGSGKTIPWITNGMLIYNRLDVCEHSPQN